MQFAPTRPGKQLEEHSVRQPGSFCSAPLASESLAAKATASACPVGSVFLSLAPRIRLAPYRPPCQTRARLHSRRPDSREPASKPLPLTAAPQRHCHKRPVAEQHSPAIWPHFPCCPPGWRNPPPAWSVPAPYRDGLHTPRCQMRAPVQSSLRACPQTTFAVPRWLRSPTRERQERREHCAV